METILLIFTVFSYTVVIFWLIRFIAGFILVMLGLKKTKSMTGAYKALRRLESAKKLDNLSKKEKNKLFWSDADEYKAKKAIVIYEGKKREAFVFLDNSVYVYTEYKKHDDDPYKDAHMSYVYVDSLDYFVQTDADFNIYKSHSKDPVINKIMITENLKKYSFKFDDNGDITSWK